ncbi:MAG: DUF1592 domain-containing protein, partial [Planctomycetales bacterium]|nr:DUF1592 domain-containing protein [Planctomycetales bacterium]
CASHVLAGDFSLFTQEFCLECHRPGSAEADIELTRVTKDNLKENAILLRKILHALETKEMPPHDAKQPESERRLKIIEYLQPILTAAEFSTKQAITPIRRMNRFQYNNAVIDLFDLNCTVFTLPECALRIHNDYFQPATGKMPESVKVGNRPLGKSQMIEPRLADVAAFPQDLRAENGFDNRADHLSMSPLLMDEFLKLGQLITQSPDFNVKHVGIWNAFFAPPAEGKVVRAEVRTRLDRFLNQAFRGEAHGQVVERYEQYVLHQLADGADFSEVMKSVAAAILASPRFLYLYEKQETTASEQRTLWVDDFELASRLSFFLWGSLPDEELLAAARGGNLSQVEVLERQIDRLLNDKKLKRFCDSFPSQWLQLDRILSSVPNPEKYPEFYFAKYRVSMHMMLEPLLLFESILIEDLPITQLIDSDFTYRSSKLEQAYGVLGNEPSRTKADAVTVLDFRRVPVRDRRTGGVITNAAVMTMTSGTERTQPITRGAWIAGVILNAPPPPPPGNVPPLPDKPLEGEEQLSLRQRLVAHRERSDCRGCHERIDPLGFAFENYDAVGRWRESYENGIDIDASGSIFGKNAYDNPIEFKDALLSEKDIFCRAFAGHLLSFALARELGPADQPALSEIVEAVAADGYKMQTLIRQIILSKPFRTKS